MKAELVDADNLIDRITPVSPASLARAHGAKAAVVALPLLLAVASSEWLTSSIGDADC